MTSELSFEELEKMEQQYLKDLETLKEELITTRNIKAHQKCDLSKSTEKSALADKIEAHKIFKSLTGLEIISYVKTTVEDKEVNKVVAHIKSIKFEVTYPNPLTRKIANFEINILEPQMHNKIQNALNYYSSESTFGVAMFFLKSLSNLYEIRKSITFRFYEENKDYITISESNTSDKYLIKLIGIVNKSLNVQIDWYLIWDQSANLAKDCFVCEFTCDDKDTKKELLPLLNKLCRSKIVKKYDEEAKYNILRSIIIAFKYCDSKYVVNDSVENSISP